LSIYSAVFILEYLPIKTFEEHVFSVTIIS